MSTQFPPPTPRQGNLSAWCPTCRATRACSPNERAGADGYRCDTCHGVTHQPVLRIARPSLDETSPAA